MIVGEVGLCIALAVRLTSEVGDSGGRKAREERVSNPGMRGLSLGTVGVEMGTFCDMFGRQSPGDFRWVGYEEGTVEARTVD